MSGDRIVTETGNLLEKVDTDWTTSNVCKSGRKQDRTLQKRKKTRKMT